MSSQVSSPNPCSQPLLFNDLGSRKVVADFSGGHLSSDGGLLLLRELDSSLCSAPHCFVELASKYFVGQVGFGQVVSWDGSGVTGRF